MVDIVKSKYTQPTLAMTPAKKARMGSMVATTRASFQLVTKPTTKPARKVEK